MSDQWIQASEISDYVYCHRAWWLRRMRGAVPANVRELHRGRAYHQKHGRQVRHASWARRAAYVLILIAVGFIVMQLLAGV